MSDQGWIEALRKKVPNIAAAFDRARKGPKKEEERPAAQLNLNPPAPGLGGQTPASRPLVSPQLRERIERKEALKKLIKRAFTEAARDAIER